MQQWIKAPLDFFWNRIGKKEITQQSLGGAIEAQGWESFGFSQLEVTWFVFLALPHGHCCARRTGACLCLYSPESHKGTSERSNSASLSRTSICKLRVNSCCVKVTIQPVSCVSESCRCSSPNAYTPQREGNDETSKEASVEHIVRGPLPPFQTNGMWQRQPLRLPSAAFVLNFANHQALGTDQWLFSLISRFIFVHSVSPYGLHFLPFSRYTVKAGLIEV